MGAEHGYAMKINVSYPATGCQKLIEIEDERKMRPFYDRRMAQEVSAEPLGDEWKGYIVRITGGNDKQGFPMKQGVLTAGRVRLLLGKGHKCYRQRRTGERKRRSVRGCIVDAQLSVLNLAIVKKGDNDIPGLTDTSLPKKEGKPAQTKAPKIQRLVTPGRLQKKRHRLAVKRQRTEKALNAEAEYKKLLAKRLKDMKEKKAEATKKRRLSSMRKSESAAGK